MNKFDKYGPYSDDKAKAWFISNFDPNELNCDISYQRESTDSKIKEFKNNWKPDAAGVLYCSLRKNGDVYVIDGNHRKQAALSLGRSVNIFLIDFTEKEEPEIEEARLFILLNKHRTGMSGLAQLNAEFCAEIPEAKKIVKAVRKYHFNVDEHHKNIFTLKCISLLKSSVRSGHLAHILQFLSSVETRDYSKNKVSMLKPVKEQKFLEVIYTITCNKNLTVSDLESIGNRISKQDIRHILDIIGISKGDGKKLKNGIPDRVVEELPHLFQNDLILI